MLLSKQAKISINFSNAKFGLYIPWEVGWGKGKKKDLGVRGGSQYFETFSFFFLF